MRDDIEQRKIEVSNEINLVKAEQASFDKVDEPVDYYFSGVKLKILKNDLSYLKSLLKKFN